MFVDSQKKELVCVKLISTDYACGIHASRGRESTCSYRDGEYFKENSLLNDYEFKIALGQTQNVCSVLGVNKHSCEVQVNSSVHPTCSSLQC